MSTITTPAQLLEDIKVYFEVDNNEQDPSPYGSTLRLFVKDQNTAEMIRDYVINSFGFHVSYIQKYTATAPFTFCISL
jgi:hypothetical protein